MSKSAKVRLIVLCAFVLLTLFASLAHPSRESEFRSLFSDLSIGVPGHQTIIQFNRPADVIKDDYFETIFVESDKQFQQFCTRTGVSAERLLNSSGASVAARSRIDPDYPWLLDITAEITNTPEKLYRVKIEGHQP